MRRLLPIVLVGLVLGGCVTTAGSGRTASAEWQAFDLLSRYAVVQRTLEEMVAHPQATPRTRRELHELESSIHQAIAPLAEAARRGEQAALPVLLARAEPLVTRQLAVMTLDDQVDRSLALATGLSGRLLAEDRAPQPADWRRLIAQIRATADRIAAAAGVEAPDRLARRAGSR